MLCTYAINAWINFSAAPLLGFVLETILLTFLLLLFGEIMPKIYAQKNSVRFVRFSASVLSGLERFCRPFSKILVNSTSVINKALAKKKYDISVDELSKALELTSTEIPEEKEMLASYVQEGGKLMVMAGPTEDGVLTNLYSLLEDYGVTTSEGIVVESDRNYYAFQAPYVLLPEIVSSDITDSLIAENYYVLMPISQGLTVGT